MGNHNVQNDYIYEHFTYKLCFSFLYFLYVNYWWAPRSNLGVQSIHLHLLSVKKLYCMHITKVTSDPIEYQHCKKSPVPTSERKLRRLDGLQITHQIFHKFLDNYDLFSNKLSLSNEKTISFNYKIWLFCYISIQRSSS